MGTGLVAVVVVVLALVLLPVVVTSLGAVVEMVEGAKEERISSWNSDQKMS